MKKLLALLAFLASLSAALADPLSPWMNPWQNTSSMTLTSATTAYTAGQLIATSATAASVAVPFFDIPRGYQGALIPRVRVSFSDTTSTSWGGQTIQIDFWSCAPTFTNGDRGTWLPATGAACHLAAYTCVMPSTVWGDGIATECAINVGNFALSAVQDNNTATNPPHAAIYWTADAITGSGVTGASKLLRMTPEFLF